MKKSHFFFTALIGLAFLFFWGYFPTLSRYQELKFQEEEMDRKLRSLDTRIRELQEEKKMLQNDVAYLERVIRDELGLVKPGEIVYKFVEEPPPHVASQAAPAEPPVSPPSSPVTPVGSPAVIPEAAVQQTR